MSFIHLVRQYFIEGYNEEGLDFLKKHVLLTDMDGKVNHLVDFVRTHFAHSCSTKTLFHRTFWPPTATQLHECGVVFRTDKGSKKCAVDVAFIDYDGCLELPYTTALKHV